MSAPRGPRGERPQTHAGDKTGLRAQALEAETAHRDAEAAREKSAAKADQEHRKRHEVIDYTGDAGYDKPLPEADRDEVDIADPYRTVRMKYEIEDMVFGREVKTEGYTDDDGKTHEVQVPGRIRTWSFSEGRQYRLPRAMADHLDERGFVLH
jgi:hypothetical protein